MAPANIYPSIHSFYRRDIQRTIEEESGALAETIPSDGFTEEELSDALHPLNRKWDPERGYEELEIGDLVPCPKAVTFIGRLVSISTIWNHSQKLPKAAGWHYLVLKNNTAAISVLHLSHQMSFIETYSFIDQIVFRWQSISLALRPRSISLDGFHIRCLQIGDQCHSIYLGTRELISRSCRFRSHHNSH